MADDCLLRTAAGLRILIERERIGWTQRQLTRALGCHRNSVSLWETGEHLPSVEYLIALAEVFGVTVDYLLAREER